ncbi:HlyD family type I secretion periplasmic adaptor subunit [Sphingomonas sp. MAH-20]|uniref:Membrane fusion protein (MFP) family protein n=1 Tax=Sphingomonas horti TaxID=2682842 RepID=A0A6I4J0W3_9SPHN|nr:MULTISPECIES: HlyD family type I secretion periplasmic adaptor subunit [Sphingomonas]MBA2919786.1 HlyD family type I secretion periplasmic adaptor subunit [Sphingomonas sp. CGMCC 1.13658]MVO78027.1 HlyD family type I secretion periplasmic adaptor subunit [Sphingomonas horti]
MTPARGSLIVIALATLAVLGFIAWSFWAELDQITRARGQVIPTGRVQTVQAATEGTVNAILVKEGDDVAKGQLLVSLDTVSVGAAVEEGKARVAALKATMARIEAELFNRPLSFPPDVAAFPELANNQRMLLQSRRAALNADISALSSQLSLARQELNLNRPLVQSGDIARAELLRLQRSVSDLSGQIASRRSRYLEDLQAEYAKTQEELTTAEQALTQRSDQLANAELRAPVAGVVSNLRISTVGAVLRPGDEVMQIIPAGARLIVEAHLSPADIAFIHPGQEASIKFDAFDSSIYGSATGKVIFVSPDTTTISKPDGAGQESFYRVQLAVDTSSMHPKTAGERIVIQPGMTATAEIKTGRTTVFRYLTKPILKTASEAMGER